MKIEGKFSNTCSQIILWQILKKFIEKTINKLLIRFQLSRGSSEDWDIAKDLSGKIFHLFSSRSFVWFGEFFRNFFSPVLGGSALAVTKWSEFDHLNTPIDFRKRNCNRLFHVINCDTIFSRKVKNTVPDLGRNCCSHWNDERTKNIKFFYPLFDFLHLTVFDDHKIFSELIDLLVMIDINLTSWDPFWPRFVQLKKFWGKTVKLTSIRFEVKVKYQSIGL